MTLSQSRVESGYQWPHFGKESDLLDLLIEWIQRDHRDGGDFSVDAIVSAGEAARGALRSDCSLQQALEAGKDAYLKSLGRLDNNPA